VLCLIAPGREPNQPVGGATTLNSVDLQWFGAEGLPVAERVHADHKQLANRGGRALHTQTPRSPEQSKQNQNDPSSYRVVINQRGQHHRADQRTFTPRGVLVVTTHAITSQTAKARAGRQAARPASQRWGQGSATLA